MHDKELVRVIGLGYVGLPIALASAEAGFAVEGIDINSSLVSKLNSGQNHISDIPDELIIRHVKDGTFKASNVLTKYDQASTTLVCVPTPLNDLGHSDLSHLQSSMMELGKVLVKGDLVVIESTVAPGTTRNTLIPILEESSGLSREDFFVAFSPERVDPSNKVWSLYNTPKLVAGFNDYAKERASFFYREISVNVVICSSLEVAEAAKLLENSFRLLNISFINELAIYCNRIGIEINDVVRAAATKPYGFMPFYPSIGIGGHCIPVDPIYLVESARASGAPIQIIELAAHINTLMPKYFIGKAAEKINGLAHKKILVVGVAYKPNVSDTRETPSSALISGLREKDAEVYWHDDLVKEWNGEVSVPLDSSYDLAIIATAHDYIDFKKLGEIPILDTRKSTL